MNKKAIPNQQLNYQHIAQIKNDNFERSNQLNKAQNIVF